MSSMMAPPWEPESAKIGHFRPKSSVFGGNRHVIPARNDVIFGEPDIISAGEFPGTARAPAEPPADYGATTRSRRSAQRFAESSFPPRSSAVLFSGAPKHHARFRL